jgi:PIN domain nuclease of toxin-antitoxin system
LDADVLIWVASAVEKLTRSARALLDEPENLPLFSPASLGEIAIKSTLNRGDFRLDGLAVRHGLLHNGYEELAIQGEHAVAIYSLPPIHEDPFDRILIAQTIVEGVRLLTADATVARYPGPIRKL